MKDKISVYIYLTACLALFAILALCVLAPGENLMFPVGEVLSLDKGWSYAVPGEAAAEFAPPARLQVPKGWDYAVSVRLADDFPEGMTVCTRSTLQRLRVLLDGSTIYAQVFEQKSRMNLPISSMWHLVELPPGAAGKTLTLVLNSPYPTVSGLVNPVFYGTESAVLYHIIRTCWPGLVLSLLITIIGIVLIAVTLAVKTASDRGILYLGLFAVFISLWLLAESKMLQFLTGNQFFIGGSAYIALTIFPIPMLLYIRETVVEHGRDIYSGLAWLFVADLIGCTACQLLGITDFFESVPVTHALLVVTIAVVIATLLVEARKHRNREALRFLGYIGILLVFSAFEFANFYSADYSNTSVFIRIGVILYISVLGVDSIRRLQKLIDRSRETQFFERMAYMDILTGGKNRTAYDRDLRVLLTSPAAPNLRLVVLDLNGLKNINDRLGHVTGDRALRVSYSCITEAFGKLGECYRIGGDEFACILPGCGAQSYECALRRFGSLVSAANAEQDFEISIAVGCAVYNPALDASGQDFLSRADQTMYLNKRNGAPTDIAVPGS